MNGRSHTFLSCKKATALNELNNENQLDWKDRTQLKLHLLMCKGCSQYAKQNKMMSKALENYFKTEDQEGLNIMENQALKRKIISRIE